MTTSADTHINNATTLIREAVKNLSKVFIDQCDGHNDYNKLYREKVEKVFYELVRLRNILDEE